MPTAKSIFIPEAPVTREEDDLLGFKPHVGALYDALKHTTLDGPVVVGVYGPWGSGKTSFMELLRARLGDDISIWMNAWAYDRREAVWLALIRLLMQKVKSRQALPERVKTRAERVVQTAVHVGGGWGAKFATHGMMGGPEVTQMVKAITEESFDSIQELTTKFSNEFEDLVNEYLSDIGKKGDAELVVFVDDLDRCSPDTVVAVFQALKVFLNRGKVVYVLGMDPVSITHSVRAAYPQCSEAWARGFIEKIVDVAYHVPMARPDHVMHAMAARAGCKFPDSHTAAVASMLAGGNPRRAKRYTRAWHAAKAMVPPEISSDEAKRAVFALAVGLWASYPEVYKLALQDPQGIGAVAGAWGSQQMSELGQKWFEANRVAPFAELWRNLECNGMLSQVFEYLDKPCEQSRTSKREAVAGVFHLLARTES